MSGNGFTSCGQILNEYGQGFAPEDIISYPFKDEDGDEGTALISAILLVSRHLQEFPQETQKDKAVGFFANTSIILEEAYNNNWINVTQPEKSFVSWQDDGAKKFLDDFLKDEDVAKDLIKRTSKAEYEKIICRWEAYAQGKSHTEKNPDLKEDLGKHLKDFKKFVEAITSQPTSFDMPESTPEYISNYPAPLASRKLFTFGSKKLFWNDVLTLKNEENSICLTNIYTIFHACHQNIIERCNKKNHDHDPVSLFLMMYDAVTGILEEGATNITHPCFSQEKITKENIDLVLVALKEDKDFFLNADLKRDESDYKKTLETWESLRKSKKIQEALSQMDDDEIDENGNPIERTLH